MKTIKKKPFIRSPTFVWALILLLLLSSMIGTTVWAKADKPDKPGKPSPPEPEFADFKIWIGSGELDPPEDVVLQPYGEEETNYLLVENYGYFGRWLPPPTKGKYTLERWNINLVSLDPPEGPGDYCGKYSIYHEELAGKLGEHGIDSEDEAYAFTVEHRTQNQPRYGEYDYWIIGVAWQIGTYDSDPDIPHLIILMGATDRYIDFDFEPEGVYNDNDDTWTVYFNEAEFVVGESTESGGIEVLWTVQLSFTVKIERTLV